MTPEIGNMWYWLVLVGLFGGALSGALGVGAGILVVPALVLGLGFAQKSAQGIALAVMVPMALTGALRYYVNPAIKINPTVVLVLIPFAVIGALVGSHFAAILPAVVLRKCFGVFVIVAGIKMIM